VTFGFVSGDLALDFAATLKWRRRAEPEELLRSPADVAEWAAEAGVLTMPPWVSPAELEGLVRLREAVYRLVQGDDAGLTLVNAAASGAGPRLSLVDGALVRAGDAGALASAVASAALELVASDAAVKECAREDCTRLFVDRSRGGRRSWCGMEECGNLQKARAYRARKVLSGP
jgi:predicted RNA-binding Zn ribbon-like protein